MSWTTPTTHRVHRHLDHDGHLADVFDALDALPAGAAPETFDTARRLLERAHEFDAAMRRAVGKRRVDELRERAWTTATDPSADMSEAVEVFAESARLESSAAALQTLADLYESRFVNLVRAELEHLAPNWETATATPYVAALVEEAVKIADKLPAGVDSADAVVAVGTAADMKTWRRLGEIAREWLAVAGAAEELRKVGALPTPLQAGAHAVVMPAYHLFAVDDLNDLEPLDRVAPELLVPRATALGLAPGLYTADQVLARVDADASTVQTAAWDSRRVVRREREARSTSAYVD